MRIVMTVISFIVWGWVNFATNLGQTLFSAQVAGKQFQESDMSYIQAIYGMNLFSWLGGISTILLLFILFMTWRKYLPQAKKVVKDITIGTTLAAMLMFGMTNHASAYWDTINKAEAYTVMPNESAFWIPSQGDSKGNQVELDSQAYLEANKVVAKLFIVPHAKFANSGGWASWDAYIPTGRLIMVDRTPYNQEWAKDSTRGTSAKDESFPCQTAEGINVIVEMSVAASVTEQNAAKFLYNFGVNPLNCGQNACNLSDPVIIFNTVYYGKSLSQVMNSIGRNRIQTLVCNEVSARSLDQMNKDLSGPIIASVQKQATAWLLDRGITLDFIGYAGTVTFDKDVQQAINDRYTAQAIQPYIATLQAKAGIDAVEKWDGHSMPSSLTGLIPSDLLSTIAEWFRPSKATVATSNLG